MLRYTDGLFALSDDPIQRPGLLATGVLLRLSGLALALAGAVVLATSGEANGILAFAIGALLWLAGHWLYAVRHLEYKSPLADFFFCRCVPDWLDPARDRRTI